MNKVNELRARLQAALSDPELRRLSPGLSALVRIDLGDDATCMRFAEGTATLQMTEAGETIRIAAAASDWDQVLTGR